MLRALLWIVAAATLACQQPAQAQQVQSAADAAAEPARNTLQVEVRVDDKPWARPPAAASQGQRLRLRVQNPAGPQALVRWFLVFPDLTRPYNNANPPGSHNAYQWRGIDPIDYYRVELTHLRGQWEVEPFAKGAPAIFASVRAWLKDRDAEAYASLYHDDLGTFHFQAVVEDLDKRWRSPGPQDRDSLGLSPRVARVSLHDGDAWPGRLRAWFNVPGVFGSTTPQANGHVGVDCADALMAAWGEHRGRAVQKNYNVDALVGLARDKVEADLSGGAVQGTPLRWGDDVSPGDLVAVRYDGASRYQHIGALDSDADGDGLLGPEDLILHAGPWPLQRSRLDTGFFDGHVIIFKPQKTW
jgi:hypothetical protein